MQETIIARRNCHLAAAVDGFVLVCLVLRLLRVGAQGPIAILRSQSFDFID
jgi:hypothetical protein